MKHTIVNDLWRGELNPRDANGVYYKELCEIVGYVEHHRTALEKILDEQGRKLLEKLDDAYGEWLYIENEDSFCKGFSLGVKFIIATLHEE